MVSVAKREVASGTENGIVGLREDSFIGLSSESVN